MSDKGSDVPRKRGRPRKYPPKPVDPNKPKRPRGRPKKSDDEKAKEPPKVDDAPKVDHAKPRGRPKKNSTVTKPAPPPAPVVDATKKKRGRPKKSETADQEAVKKTKAAKKSDSAASSAVAAVENGIHEPAHESVTDEMLYYKIVTAQRKPGQRTVKARDFPPGAVSDSISDDEFVHTYSTDEEDETEEEDASCSES